MTLLDDHFREVAEMVAGRLQGNRGGSDWWKLSLVSIGEAPEDSPKSPQREAEQGPGAGNRLEPGTTLKQFGNSHRLCLG